MNDKDYTKSNTAAAAHRPTGFGYARSVTDRVEECTWQTLNAVIDSAAVADICAELLRMKRLRDGGGMTPADYDRRKAALKRRLPVIMPHAMFPSGRRRNSEAVPSGLAMYDADHIGDPHEYWEHKVMAACGGCPERLGIVIAHITPSYEGVRLIFRMPAGMTLAEAQQWMASRLGDTVYDASVKDYARCSFLVPRGYFFVLEAPSGSPEGGEPCASFCSSIPPASQSARLSPPSGEPEGAAHDTQSSSPSGELEGAASFCSSAPPTNQPARLSPPSGELEGAAQPSLHSGELEGASSFYATVIDAWWKANGGVPAEGERNTKLYHLAQNLRYICDNRESLLLSIVPRLGLSEEEVRAVVRSACSAPVRAMPKTMWRVLAEAGRLHQTSQGVKSGKRAPASAGVTKHGTWQRWWRRMPPLPAGLHEATNTVEPRLRMGAVLAQLVMIYTLLTRIRFTHFDGTETRLSGMTFIIGPAACGKAFINRLDEMWMEPVRAADAKGRHMEAEYRREKELRKNERKQMDRPHPVIRVVPIQISNAMLITRLMDAVEESDGGMTTEHLHLYSCETELATALRAQRGGTWIEKNDIYCKAFHNEPWGVDYASDQVTNGEVEVNYNLVVSGTEDAFNTFVPPGTVLSGLPTRLMYFPMDAEPFRMIEYRKKVTDTDSREQVRKVAWRLDRLGGRVDATALTTAMYKWCTEQAERAETELDYELDDLRKRTALIGERAGVAYAIMEHLDEFERTGQLNVSARAIKFARVVADFCLDMQYIKFAEMMRERKASVSERWRMAERKIYTADVFDALPEHFTTADVHKLRHDKNVNTNIKLVKYWLQQGYVKRGKKRGEYSKKW